MAARTLLLLRHAKSDWSGDPLDLDRPLAKRGRRQAPEAGHWLAANIAGIDLAVVSNAEREPSHGHLGAGLGDPRTPTTLAGRTQAVRRGRSRPARGPARTARRHPHRGPGRAQPRPGEPGHPAHGPAGTAAHRGTGRDRTGGHPGPPSAHQPVSCKGPAGHPRHDLTSRSLKPNPRSATAGRQHVRRTFKRTAELTATLPASSSGLPDQDHGTEMGPDGPTRAHTRRQHPTRDMPADLHKRPRLASAVTVWHVRVLTLIRGLWARAPRGPPLLTWPFAPSGAVSESVSEPDGAEMGPDCSGSAGCPRGTSSDTVPRSTPTGQRKGCRPLPQIMQPDRPQPRVPR
jgi:hypothetical protein